MVSYFVVNKWILCKITYFIVNFVQFSSKNILLFSHSIKKIQARVAPKTYYQTSQKVIFLKKFVIITDSVKYLIHFFHNLDSHTYNITQPKVGDVLC